MIPQIAGAAKLKLKANQSSFFLGFIATPTIPRI